MKGIQFGVVWWDDDFIELAVAADNGRFAAQTRAFVGPSFGPDFARVLEGFPRAPDDERQHTLGTFEDHQ